MTNRINKLVSATVASFLITSTGQASSHREAPGIANDPSVDITDVYVFKGEGRRSESHVTFIMNVYPGQLPQAGPNWYSFADDALYQLNIDTNGDAQPDLSYRVRFNTKAPIAPELPIAYGPAVSFNGKQYTYNLAQNYSVSRVTYKGTRQISERLIGKEIPVAPARVGPGTTDYVDPKNPTDFNSASKTDPRVADRLYSVLAGNAVKSVGNYRFFAGPRNDPFYVDLGGAFDALNIRVPGLSGTPVDGLAGFNVLSIAIEVPVSDLGGARIFGTWATTHRRQLQLRSINSGRSFVAGGFVQVSRLGNPLVNELVIGFKDKDRFNATAPAYDVANYAKYVTSPGLAGLLNALYGKENGATAKLLEPVQENDRADLVAAFVTGIPGINAIPGGKGTGDMIRTNLDLPIGWPNGRTLKDDVVGTALKVLAGCKSEVLGFPAGLFGMYDSSTVNCALDDGLTADDKTIGGTGQTAYFPYMGIPHSSYGVRGAIKK